MVRIRMEENFQFRLYFQEKELRLKEGNTFGLCHLANDLQSLDLKVGLWDFNLGI